jgi:tRNA(fMet)-specific endonuclease VapC
LQLQPLPLTNYLEVTIAMKMLSGQNFFSQVTILDFSLKAAMEAGKIYKDLKSKGMMIDIEDILIAAIAISNNLKLATDNKNHFSRINGLETI